MKKNIWIINHYAGQMYFEKGMRHYWIAKFLKQKDYNPVVICSNSKHNSNGELYFDNEAIWSEHIAEDINVPFAFIRSRPYSDNGRQRILNMVDFYRNLLKCRKDLAIKYGKPDMIYASSVHPLTLVAGLKLAKSFRIRCACEIRDLWPESLVAYGMLNRNSIIARLLYYGEKRIYKKADKVVMTWPGGYDYITDQGWSRQITHEKVVHISNGVDLEEYRNNIKGYPFTDDCFSGSIMSFVYTGSVRKVNNLSMLIDAAEILKKRDVSGYQLLIFGDGDERASLEEHVRQKELTDVRFMGRVPKQQIPSVLTQADVNILHNSSSSLDKYGQSQNKFFEYLASGKPILMTYSVGHSIVKEKDCGIEVDRQTPEAIADAIETFIRMPKDRLKAFSENSSACVGNYDFKILTEQVIGIIEESDQ